MNVELLKHYQDKLSRFSIDSSWTLFLDRDGVINIEKKDDYIRSVDEFIFYENVMESFPILNKIFHKVIIVTNQRGIGRGLMTHEDLQGIHLHVLSSLQKKGGYIDAFYYAPDLDKEAPNRKPNIGMGLQAKEKFPSIDFTKSIMVGNNLSDMEFGKRLGMKTVFVETTKKIDGEHEWIDIKLDTLVDFIQLLSPST